MDRYGHQGHHLCTEEAGGLFIEIATAERSTRSSSAYWFVPGATCGFDIPWPGASGQTSERETLDPRCRRSHQCFRLLDPRRAAASTSS